MRQPEQFFFKIFFSKRTQKKNRKNIPACQWWHKWKTASQSISIHTAMPWMTAQMSKVKFVSYSLVATVLSNGPHETIAKNLRWMCWPVFWKCVFFFKKKQKWISKNRTNYFDFTSFDDTPSQPISGCGLSPIIDYAQNGS